MIKPSQCFLQKVKNGVLNRGWRRFLMHSMKRGHPPRVMLHCTRSKWPFLRRLPSVSTPVKASTCKLVTGEYAGGNQRGSGSAIHSQIDQFWQSRETNSPASATTSQLRTGQHRNRPASRKHQRCLASSQQQPASVTLPLRRRRRGQLEPDGGTAGGFRSEREPRHPTSLNR